MGRSRDQALRNGVWVSPSGPSGHLPMNGEEQRSSSPKWGLGQPLRRLRRHLPMNGEEQRSSSPKRGLGQPLRPFGPPPHEWGGAEVQPLRPCGPPPREWGGARGSSNGFGSAPPALRATSP